MNIAGVIMKIITYCNKLVYEGKLEPKRGSFYAAEYNELRGLLPVMGFRQVTTAKSEKYGGSRRNREEAEAIIMWLQKKYEKNFIMLQRQRWH